MKQVAIRFCVRMVCFSNYSKWNVDVFDDEVGDFVIDEYFTEYHEALKLYENIEPAIFLALAQRE